jgi:hypothetical protein
MRVVKILNTFSSRTICKLPHDIAEAKGLCITKNTERSSGAVVMLAKLRMAIPDVHVAAKPKVAASIQ